jgi:hypothetical protein
MSSSSNKRQTMAKFARERTLREKRALKQEKKEERRLAAAARNAEATNGTPVEIDDATEGSPPVESADSTQP